MVSNQKSEIERFFDLDFIRVVSGFAVILLHVSSDYVKELDINSLDWWIANFCNTISRFCVPLFVMASGAILLDREPDKYQIKARSLKIIKVYLLASIIYGLYHIFIVKDVQYQSFIINFLNGEAEYHLWFLYLILSLYIITPVLLGIKNLSNRQFFTVCFWICILHNISIYINYFLKLEINILYFKDDFFVYICYYIFGYLIYKKILPSLNNENQYWMHISTIIFWCSVVLATLTTGITSIQQQKYSGDFFIENANILVIIMSLTCFINLYNLAKKISNNYQNNLKLISSTILGIYIIHPIFLDQIDEYLKPNFDQTLGSNLLIFKILIYSILVFSICFIFIYLIRKWKPIRNIL